MNIPRSVILLLLLAITFMSCTGGRMALSEGGRIIFFGDSITELGVKPYGYVSLIRETITSRHPGTPIEVILAGVSGNKIADLRQRLVRIQAEDEGYTPQISQANSPHEWLPFIKAYANTGNLATAGEITLASFNVDQNYQTVLCHFWDDIETEISPTEHEKDTIQEIQDLMQPMNEQTEKQLQSLLAVTHEWVTSFERSIGRAR